MNYPYVAVLAYDVTDVEQRASVELRFVSGSLPGVTEQDVVDAVTAVFAQMPNVTVAATRYEVTSSPV
ncbi:hypothetical protein ACIG0D_01580 [Streptomyces sp. NPDC052773]|uniref:hypothetical protein n=1 Tax=Streptomyces sp. NPDC052773 TaxID=3365693 RepID=UPI0037D8EB38